MKRKNVSVVAEFVREQVEKSGLTVDEVASRAGMSGKVLKMIVEGQTKLPINQTPRLAEALGVDGVYLLRLVLEENLPEVWAIIQANLAELGITDFEQEVVEGYRQLGQGRNIPVFMFPAQGYVEVVPPKSTK